MSKLQASYKQVKGEEEMILTHKQEVLEHIGETSSSIYDKAYNKGRADERKDFEDIVIGLTNEEARRIKKETAEEFANYIKKNYRIGVNTIDEVLQSFLTTGKVEMEERNESCNPYQE